MAQAMWRKALDPSRVDDYIRAHANVWPEMLEHIRRSGMRNYSIFVDGADAIGYFEHDNLSALDSFNAQPHEVALAWRELMRPLSADTISPEAGTRQLRRQVFFLE